jgi:hypothetical protein
MLAAGLFYAFNYNNTTMGFITNEAKDCKHTDVITSLNKEDSKKVYNYLVGLEAKTTTENLDLENLLSQYQGRC